MKHAWILAAYPKDYRREHGPELLEPLLAESRRPTRRETANLLAHGLRTRLGRPTSRAVVAWAVFATVLAGVFGAALGSWVGWHTAAPLPRPAWTRALLADVLPGRDVDSVDAPPSSTFALQGHVLSWNDTGDLLFGDLLIGDGGGYRPATTVALIRFPADADLDALVSGASSRLAATGWTVRTPTGDPGPARIQAVRDGLALDVRANPASSDRDVAWVSAEFGRTTPAGAWIGGVAGALPAAAVVFLAFAWASRRTGQPGHPARLAVAFPFGSAMLFWSAPTLVAVPLVASSVRSRARVGTAPLWEWLGQPRFSLLFLAGVAFGVLSLLLAALPSDRELQRAREADEFLRV